MDEVFAAPGDGTRARTRLRFLLAALAALLAHGSLVLWARGTEQSLESWATELALRVHAELSKEELVELSKPLPPPPPAPPPPVPPPAVREKLAEPRRTAPPSAPSPPAAAAAIVAAEPAPNAPLDLTGETFVTGNANAYAGGVTSGTGTSRTPVRAVVPASAAARLPRPSRPDLSSKVALQEQDWQCPWPREAEGEPIDEQVVILRVVVRPDGSAESAALVHGPGHGFGEAALACALRTRFTPGHGRDGEPVTQQSPPIRVRFTR
ncbi:MAG: TonB family protein [Polyangiales bacterium]